MQTLTVSDDRVWIQTLAEGQMSMHSLSACVCVCVKNLPVGS